MDNVVKIKILGLEFMVSSPDNEEYIKYIASVVNEKAEEIITEDPGITTSKAALIAAMDFCEDQIKYHKIAVKLRKRLLRDEEELARLSKESSHQDLLTEINELKEKLVQKDKEIKKKETEMSVLKEDVVLMENYRRSLAEKEKEVKELKIINGSLETSLKEAEAKIVELSNTFGSDDDFDGYDIEDLYISPDVTEEKDDGYSQEIPEEEDIIIPGYLEDNYSDSEEETNIDNPFGIDYSN